MSMIRRRVFLHVPGSEGPHKLPAKAGTLARCSSQASLRQSTAFRRTCRAVARRAKAEAPKGLQPRFPFQHKLSHTPTQLPHYVITSGFGLWLHACRNPVSLSVIVSEGTALAGAGRLSAPRLVLVCLLVTGKRPFGRHFFCPWTDMGMECE